ncbi:preprotein translocase, SecE subunit [Thermanaerovibrio acidaminovorans DSM 6589]|uniref:Protein translocase subunit SecE n=1 Tax=Thermanaerovibrio acidaminovorans (strain ATCC 49978 / DSM 6589 / Su883) TaxID=525903 RepID=D1B6U3_THEAS|nr:preprotein translocase, SecE subunit [Thermanaerovibrio acidaminovorans DSM 6589]
MGRVIDFLREARGELKKVAWPTRQQVWYSTLVVLFVTFAVSAYLGLVDAVLTGLLRGVVR